MQIVIDIPEELKSKIDNANDDNYRTIICWSKNNNDVILHKDYALIDSPHDFIDIDGKLYVSAKYIINLGEAEE